MKIPVLYRSMGVEDRRIGRFRRALSSAVRLIGNSLFGIEIESISSPSFSNRYREIFDHAEFALHVVDSRYILREDLVKAVDRGVVVHLAINKEDSDPVQESYLRRKGVNVHLVDPERLIETQLRTIIADREDVLSIDLPSGRYVSIRNSMRVANRLMSDFDKIIAPI